ncbi:MAG TPA: class I SAM-dependent methyltransferase [Acidimicrobiales bacterium]|nr:class I SAM-dependent methyltransferase [Acidimicrobiales bacterium]
MAATSDPKDFYTGLVAQLYEPLRSSTFDPEPYARFIGVAGEPALELGCGAGDPLLGLRKRGLDVEGLDASADMLTRCRDAASAEGIDVVLHHQAMQSMDLGRRYASIFLAGATFNLLPSDDDARRALQRIHDHLLPGGSALIPLFIPAPTAPPLLGVPREHRTEDGTVMKVAFVSEVRDEEARLQTAVLRYERTTSSATEAIERSWVLHWHTQNGFRALVEDADLDVKAVRGPGGRPASEDDDQFAFWVTRRA